VKIQSWFPTSIYIDQLFAQAKVGTRFSRELLEQCYLVRDTDDEGVEWSSKHYIGGYTSYGSITDLHRRFPHFEELSKHLQKPAQRMARHLDWDLQGGRLEMGSCWINIMPHGAQHSLHLHPLSVLSGTYYVQIPPGSGAIKFEDPRLDRMMAAPPRHPACRSQNQPFVSHLPRAGEFALWESWLRHEVARGKMDESKQTQKRADRVSISFNYDWV
jgi:uncharacterized protein (TIGR02466 family)